MRPQTPPIFKGQPYNRQTYVHCDTLYVPKGCKSIYEKGGISEDNSYPISEYPKYLPCGIYVREATIEE